LLFVVGTLVSVPVSAKAANIRPLGDRIIVKPVNAERGSGGIIVPDSAKDKAREGIVIGVGLGRYSDLGERIPIEVKSGDVVLFGKHSGTEVKVDGEEFLIMRESEILGLVE